jgi:ATP-dependent DNA helicase RecQ
MISHSRSGENKDRTTVSPLQDVVGVFILLSNSLYVLSSIWGYSEFRSPQGEIVDCLLAQRDALIVMPTGGGKSICFQIPALLQSGLTIVVSPLVALIENQVQELQERKISARLLHSEVSAAERQKTLDAITLGQLKLLYLSPETLLTPIVWATISQPQVKINSLILDEAHCLVHWGETFRPSYRRLGAVRSALLKFKPPGTKIAIAAFTATADPHAQATIKRVLQLDAPQEFILNPHRPNLHLQIASVYSPRARRAQLVKFIKQYPQQSGLVYARTRQDTEDLAEWLRSRGDATAAYHAGLDPRSRRQIESEWLSGKLQYVVCTCAFGMGINKPDVRWIVHFQPPLLLAEYLQEIGRAGRDGKVSHALTLTCEPTGWLYPDDRQRHKFFLDRLQAQYDSAAQIATKLPQQGAINAIERQFAQGSIALSLLHGSGQLSWTDPFTFQRQSHQIDTTAIARLRHQQTAVYQQIPTYLTIATCRWQYLLTAFGMPPATDWQCGTCDRCSQNMRK